MKIAFLTPEYPHPAVKHSAGIGTSIKNLVLELVKKKIEVSVFVYQQEENEIIEDNDVKIHLIASKSYPFLGWFLYRQYLNNYIDKYISEDNIDCIEAPDWTGITAFMKFKIPLVIRFHGSDTYFCKLDNRPQKRKNFWFEKLAIKKAQGYISPTKFAGATSAQLFGLKPEKIKTIHHGLQLENFMNQKPEQYNTNQLLYIGTIIRKKGVLKLAEIFNSVISKNPDVKLTLIGSDALDVSTQSASTYKLFEDKLTDQAKKQTKYLGKVPYIEVQNQIKKAHICVFPSFAETLGMVTIESMALQKPVVNTSIGWAKDLIDNKINGYLVHPKNVDQYADKILKLLNDKTLCLKIGKAARQKVESIFDISKIAQENIDYYKRLIKG